MTRRVYELDDDILARVEAFRGRIKIRSEVEAVRILLRAGLNSMDTPEMLIERHRSGEHPRLFGGHPLVARIEQDNGDIVSVTFRNGQVYRIEPAKGSNHV